MDTKLSSQNYDSKLKITGKFIRLAVKFISVLTALGPAAAFAQSDVSRGLNSIRLLFPIGGISGSQTLTGPTGLIYRIVSLLLFVAGALAVVFVIIGGYQYITSAGNEEQSEKGKKTLLNAIIGIVVIVLSYVIINVVVNTISGGGGIFGIFN
ncbi:MAG: hypothetical protein HYZ51_02465 [Candidatus Doudnabacteria bacterium]|nr:hypothetical protein [Candidatus Doudnabacteria bacterium]